MKQGKISASIKLTEKIGKLDVECKGRYSNHSYPTYMQKTGMRPRAGIITLRSLSTKLLLAAEALFREV
uniref:Uncharacterized protein n=1 Tax=Romanomermis culicivorax TaxID=13658 RepID=A0A915IIK2_ROMCU